VSEGHDSLGGMAPGNEAQRLPDRNVTGFYHDPPLWLVEHPIDHAQKGGTFAVEFDRLGHEVLRRDVGGGLKMRANVEGMFVFDFGDVPDLAISGRDYASFNFERMHSISVQRTRIMNAFLGFFYTHRTLIDNWSQECMVVTPEVVISVQSLDNTLEGSFGNDRVAHLAMSRYPVTYSQALPNSFDSRISNRGGPVSAACVEAAADALSDLISTYGDAGVLLIDLYLRALKAYQDNNFSFSLITYWTITERIVNELWQKLQSDFKTKDDEIFIDGPRKKRLNDGRSFTASVMSEFLSFLEYIPKDVYDDMSSVRKVRNDWMHSLRPVSLDDAKLARNVCERLLKQEMGVTLASSVPLRF